PPSARSCDCDWPRTSIARRDLPTCTHAPMHTLHKTMPILIAATLWLQQSQPAAASPVGEISELTLSQTGIGPANESCEDFVPSLAQVQAFLDKAVVTSARQQHDFFLYGPCAARGGFRTRYDLWSWEMRNLGTGSITATNGDTF